MTPARRYHRENLDAFNYLTVLVSILLGLGITQLMTGIGRMLQNRARVRMYWPVLVWVVILLLIHIQVWWSMFELRDQRAWTFPGFVAVLALPIVLYLMAALALPDFGDAVADDLRQHHEANRRWSYGLAIALVGLTFARELALEGSVDADLDSLAKLCFAGIFLVGAISTRRRVHEALVVLNLALLLVYIGALFMDLPGR